MTSVPILDVKGVKVVLAGIRVLDIPSLSLAEREVLSLIGPNGAGKSTLLKALSSLIRISAGAILFHGLEVGSDCPLPQYRKRVTMVFQDPLLFDTTVFGNVAAGLRFRGIRGREMETAVAEAMNLFGIDHLAGRAARKISGGEAQRVSLARAFATKPEVLLLDEPFSALDPPTRETLVTDLESVLRLSNITAVFATHDRTEALRLSHRIAVMHEGRILQIGSPHEIMNYPIDPFVASFVGVDTFVSCLVASVGQSTFTATVGDLRIEAPGGHKVGDRLFLCIRPEDVILRAANGSAPGDPNTFRCTVRKVTSMGPYHKVLVDCGFPLTAYVTRPHAQDLALQEGQPLTATIPPTAIHVVKEG